MKKVLLLLAVCAAVFWWLRPRQEPVQSVWQPIADGVEWRRITVSASDAFASEATVSVLRVAPSRVHIAVGQKQTATLWRQSTQSIAAINGGFFDEKGESLGLRRNRGRQLKALRPANWGVFFVKNGRAQILHTRDFQKTAPQNVQEAIQAGPRLVVDGKPTDLKDQWARRTGIGIDGAGRVLIAVSDGELSLPHWAHIWASPQGLHCRQALNLDGGGSTQLSLKSQGVSEEIAGLWPIPDVILVR